MRCALIALLLALLAGAHQSTAAPGLRAPKWTPEELDAAAEEFCSEHSLPMAAMPVQIFDAFMFNSELDMLEIRLLELYDFVDYFVILESKRTMQDRPKPLHYAENKERFARFASKIIHVVLDQEPEDKAMYRKWQQKMSKELTGSEAMAAKRKRYGELDEPFYREWWQREQLWERGVAPRATPRDMVITGDLDEIPRPKTLRALRNCPITGRHNCASLEGSFFYYSYSGYAGDWKAGPKVLAFRREDPMGVCGVYRGGYHGRHAPGRAQVLAFRGEDTMGGMDQDGLRFEGNCTLKLPKTSTHCTGCFPTIAAFQDKVASFAHWQLDKEPFTTPEFILHRVCSGLAMFDPDEKRAALKPVEYCEYAPRAVLENPHALHYLLARDATTGSFKDFDEHFGAGKQQKKSSFKLTLKRHGSVA